MFVSKCLQAYMVGVETLNTKVSSICEQIRIQGMPVCVDSSTNMGLQCNMEPLRQASRSRGGKSDGQVYLKACFASEQ